jgi:hypothetical protein
MLAVCDRCTLLLVLKTTLGSQLARIDIYIPLYFILLCSSCILDRSCGAMHASLVNFFSVLIFTAVLRLIAFQVTY